MTKPAEIPWSEIDDNVLELVRELNCFPGLTTIGSCGGHPNPGPGQWEEGTFFVTLRVEHSEQGWFALEFLAWLINSDYARGGHAVILYPAAPPPYLNEPGRMLRFVLEGREGEDPAALAIWIKKTREAHYIPPEEVR